MCVVLQRHLGKGNPLRVPRCIPSGQWRFPRTPRPDPRHAIVSPIDHSQGLEMCLSTCTEPCTNVWPFDRHLRGASALPQDPHGRGDVVSPPDPIDQPCAGWMRANLITVGLRPYFALPRNPIPQRSLAARPFAIPAWLTPSGTRECPPPASSRRLPTATPLQYGSVVHS